MTLTTLTLISAVAVVNLTLGFSAAALVGRGPWSARVRIARSHTKPPSERMVAVSSESTVEQSPAAGALPSDTAGDAEVQKQRMMEKSFQRTAAGLETIEQGLQTLLEQIQACDESMLKGSLPQWAATIMTQANQLSEILDESREVTGPEGSPGQLFHPALESLVVLQQRFQETVVKIGQVRTSPADRCGAISGLLADCQQARGAINAVSFFQTKS